MTKGMIKETKMVNYSIDFFRQYNP